MSFSISGFGSSNPFRIIVSKFEIREGPSVSCSACPLACATPARPGKPPGHPSHQRQQCQLPSRRAFKAFTHPPAFTPAPVLPFPFPTRTPHRTHASPPRSTLLPSPLVPPSSCHRQTPVSQGRVDWRPPPAPPLTCHHFL
jgi:hypothetical protein